MKIKKDKDPFTKQWIIEKAIEICERYELGVLTLRALHYQLVSIGMTNDVAHYKKVVTAMIDARWDDLIPFEQFSDHDRQMIGETDYTETSVEQEAGRAKNAIYGWMNYYFKHRWENQPVYAEVFIEKKALQGVFDSVCTENSIALGACKGYPSLTFLNDAAKRFQEAESYGKQPVILYFGDYDPSGEDIPRSIKENLLKFGVYVDVRRIALMKDQVLEWKLPPAPAKEGDSRTKNWDGLGQVELDAVRPEKLQELCQQAIDSIFDQDLFSELENMQDFESTKYKKILKEYVNTL